MARVRNTRQRQLILEVLRSTRSHPTADWLYQQVRKKMPNVSLGTIYRNLHILEEQGLIQEIHHAGQQSRYDGNPAPHYHFTCVQCQQVLDVDLPTERRLERELKQRMPELEVLGHNIEFYGRCPRCVEERREKAAEGGEP